MDCAGDDEQLLVVALELLVGILAEIAGMGILAVNEEDCALDFTGILLMEKYLFRRSNAALALPPRGSGFPSEAVVANFATTGIVANSSFKALLTCLPIVLMSRPNNSDSCWRLSHTVSSSKRTSSRTLSSG